MENKLFESELKVMELVWALEPVSAKDIGIHAEEKYSWNKTPPILS